MAFFRGSIRSKSLGMDTGLTVVLPFDRAPISETECPVVYLLHGHGENADVWTRMTAVERYANAYGVALVMPEVQRSFYTDMAMGLSYFTYVAEELPALCEKLFHIGARREDRFAAGLSMGGYGAIKLGLRCPERFAGCAGFSGCLDMDALRATLAESEPGLQNEAKAMFGADLVINPEDNLFYLLEKTARLPKSQLPKVMVTCGTEDFLYAQNVRFRDAIQALPYEFAYREWPGTHEWGFWDQSIQHALEFFFPGRKEFVQQAATKR
ncbi:MAG: alpha/beta hydrolase family protein [Oscillospiraceae bacterium]|nr:alpha/beta hydrolase family protein [Oscillospiraceae bacterium]